MTDTCTMFRYRLRTLLLLLAILPPLLWFGWTKYEAWRAEEERQKALRDAAQQIQYALEFTGAIPAPPLSPQEGKMAGEEEPLLVPSVDPPPFKPAESP